MESGTFSVEDFHERTINRIGVDEARKLPSQTKDVPQPIAPELDSLPSTSIAIRFDHKSSTVSDVSFPAVMALGRALNHPSLVKLKFLMGGHTDAVGSKTEWPSPIQEPQSITAIACKLDNPFTNTRSGPLPNFNKLGQLDMRLLSGDGVLICTEK